ncbi:MAG: hypothetical protein HLUCCX14_13335 [Marinobacter excellens HL-55]|uniref:Uncharacterized protein n=1 Tax=Marinobacter excellens HL-55 TaxID=1305731 RepID=A0A0P8CWE8_9GAMM|nr:MAG: hypothetical protein HLUCCX14_13335 [Marinobacter excellens HL-55]
MNPDNPSIGVLYQQHSRQVLATLIRLLGNDVPEDKITSFPMAVKCQPEETVVFLWIECPPRAFEGQGHAQDYGRPAPATGCEPNAV